MHKYNTQKYFIYLSNPNQIEINSFEFQSFSEHNSMYETIPFTCIILPVYHSLYQFNTMNNNMKFTFYNIEYT